MLYREFHVVNGSRFMMVRPDVDPNTPIEHQPAIGLIGMGAMGTMYAKYLSAAGWKKYVI